MDTMHVRISLNLKSTKNNSLLVQQLPVCREQTERCRDENHLGILALCCRRPKEITGRISFFSPSFSNISIPEIIRIADRFLRGAGLWKALLRFFARGKESVASHLDSTAAVCKALIRSFVREAARWIGKEVERPDNWGGYDQKEVHVAS